MPCPANLDHWWLTTHKWRRLHAVPANATNEDALLEHDIQPRLRAVCDMRRRMWWPGYLSRVGMPRCGECCRRLGIPTGKGVPANSTWRHQLGLDQSERKENG